ncbi:neuroblastoma breakpoint family member 15-like [Hylobates moloch]|uniref:neuroblastoma breakpoint family member 15-like n=1 Tax=Hylobates moloch TaxID=81572 RepID=UPI002674BC30|nr:neuroblastoma breakpoint family member 15-like [Hylobates moloch]
MRNIYQWIGKAALKGQESDKIPIYVFWKHGIKQGKQKEQQRKCLINITRHRWDQVKKEDQEATGPRLTRELLDEKEPEVLQDSLDRCYSTPSGYLKLPDLCQPYRSAVYSLEEQYLGLVLDVDKIEKYQEGEEDQNPPCPR